jgi:hypothetical protein
MSIALMNEVQSLRERVDKIEELVRKIVREQAAHGVPAYADNGLTTSKTLHLKQGQAVSRG